MSKMHYMVPQNLLQKSRPDGPLETITIYVPVCNHTGNNGGGSTDEFLVTCQRCRRYLAQRPKPRHIKGYNGTIATAQPPTPQPMPQDAYRRGGGGCCPKCKRHNIEGYSVDFDSGVISQRCFCNDCDLAWTDYYRLAGYVRTDDDTGGSEDWEAFLDTAITVIPKDV